MEADFMYAVAKKFYDMVKNLKKYELANLNHKLPDNLPNWGIGFMYEKNEAGISCEKITYITYNKNFGNFGKRLENHFFMRNKNGRRSSWRNHIARAFISKNGDDSDLFNLWHGNSNIRKAWTRGLKEGNKKYVMDKLLEYENLVDTYLKKNFSFSILSCPSKEIQRLLRSRIIATLAQTKSIPISGNWLGNFAIDGELSKISTNGIWNIECAKGRILTDADFVLLGELIEANKED
ncbi:MAG: hypothetical protein IJ207_11425 [Treponema sp.]|uniref:hypothetical protein n=1 Tax=Treponema sp. TaxID=166 RepID=UPI0025DFC58B|nr:hypothetical protein [Treponema sp.]MBQ9282785.1 hypothetical protein [Treponema sp.]MBR1722271.1 hypothetical protein [Treponema sp.]